MVGVIYFDFAKAFDKVQHQRLLFKLKGRVIYAKVFKSLFEPPFRDLGLTYHTYALHLWLILKR